MELSLTEETETAFVRLEERAACTTVEDDRTTIDVLAREYWTFIYGKLRERGYCVDQAKDLTQGFFADVLLRQKKLWEAATRGNTLQFRRLLKLVLARYLIRLRHAQAAKKRAPHNRLMSMETRPGQPPFDDGQLAPSEDLLELAGVSDVLKQVVRDVEVEWYRSGRSLYWRLFAERVLIPIEDRNPTPSLQELCRKYGVTNPRKASNMIVTVRRSLQRALIQHLRATTGSRAAATDELREIRQILSRLS